MANKKITELNEASSIASTDWLVMVDVANDETKKIHPDLVGASIPIQSAAPSGPEENDLWIDTSDDNRLKYFDGTSWEGVSDNVAGDTLPIGSIIPYGSSTAPTNWLVCDGSAVSRTTYSELFSAIGTSFGAGDGSTTFNLPNLKGKVAVGQDTTDTDFDTIGETGGSKELQTHNHILGAYGLKIAAGFNTGNFSIQTAPGNGNVNYQYQDSENSYTTNAGTGNSGNLQPYQVVCYIIKAKQSAGVVANVSKTYSTSENDTYACSYVNGIIESGSNANGYYTKYSDGTLICRYYVGSINVAGGSSATQNITFPYTFKDTNWCGSLTKTGGGSYWSYAVERIASKATTGMTISIFNNNQNQVQDLWYDYIVIGRWK